MTAAAGQTETRIEVMYWAGCPSAEAAMSMLSAELLRRGGDPAGVRVIEIVSLDEAQRECFPGSPTIRVNSRDIVRDLAPPTLSCRVYYLRDGRVSALPDIEDIRDALDAAGLPSRP